MKIMALGLCTALAIVSCKQKVSESATYEGNAISATIDRNKESKAASLNIKTDGEWKIYAGKTVEDIDFSQPLAEGNGSGTYNLTVNDTARSYFQIVTKDGKAILAEEHLPMAGGYNFRDLGGITTKDGKHIKWGKIFRSDDLSKLTQADLSYLANIPLKSLVDFRSEEETENAPDKLPTSINNYYKYSITPGSLSFESISKIHTDSVAKLMEKMNVMLVTDSAIIKEYKNFFTLLQNEQSTPIMFHCSAGKDRTGMGAALILYALGADDKTVMNNYMESNIYLADKYSGIIKEMPSLKPLFEVRPEYLQSGIDKIKQEYGSVDNYLTKVLNVDIAKFRQMYLD